MPMIFGMVWEIEYRPLAEGDWKSLGEFSAESGDEDVRGLLDRCHDGDPFVGYYRVRPAGTPDDQASVYVWGNEGDPRPLA